jgi:protoporphyrinogen oxidase
MRIAIIGTGITGLVAARELSNKGHSVTIFEQSAVVGGLAQTLSVQHHPLEKMYHHIFRTDDDILHLLQELHIENNLIWHKSSMGLYDGNRVFPFSTALDLLRFTPLRLLDRIRAGLIIVLLGKIRNWKKLSAITAAAWMKKWSGKQVFSIIWDPLLQGKFHHYHHQVSMAWLWARIHERANSRTVKRGEELGYLNGSMSLFFEALVRSLKEQNVHLRMNEHIQAIVSNAEAPKKVFLRTHDETHEFDAAVCTAPSNVFAKLVEKNPHVTNTYFQSLQHIKYLGAISLVFSTPQSLSRYYWINICKHTAPFLVIIQHTNLVGTESFQGQHVYYLSTYAPQDHILFTEDSQAVEKRFFSYVHQIFPDFDVSLVTQKELTRTPNAQHVVDCAYAKHIPEHQTPIPGVYLSNFSQIFPQDRGMSIAVQEGKNIAKLIVENEK